SLIPPLSPPPPLSTLFPYTTLFRSRPPISTGDASPALRTELIVGEEALPAGCAFTRTEPRATLPAEHVIFFERRAARRTGELLRDHRDGGRTRLGGGNLYRLAFGGPLRMAYHPEL